MRADKPPTLGQVIKSVLAAMFGVQSNKARERDFTHGKPWQYIAVALVFVLCFIGFILLTVRFVLHLAGT